MINVLSGLGENKNDLHFDSLQNLTNLIDVLLAIFFISPEIATYPHRPLAGSNVHSK
jgi:hypothetical protein